MTNFDLGQTSITTEKLTTESGEIILLDKYNFVFEACTDNNNFDTYGGKKLLKLDNETLFAELLILRLLERQGYKGVWVDTYRNKFWQRLPHVSFPVIPDRKILDIYEKIYEQKGGRKSGCFDIVAYKDNHFIFVELKKKKEDSIRQTQIEWLKTALTQNLENPTFIIAEWSL
ncbi:hypothetical protein [Epilithonimonas xixisoli]|uniref:Uncharacterized protein n=1 Tax=Epilithonimonas xixisoli TaxID=1476462 RepID=A0A4R8I2S6_9FLAO|nr:hypothetical protein [Epilithonimonas xixisoli]TDX82070.1 hypothetical protein B0I22_3433 [Epilithonimonas xixisoli]